MAILPANAYLTGGDASMGMLARLQSPEVASVFTEDQPLVSTELSRGRQGFQTQGALRTKPGKAW